MKATRAGDVLAGRYHLTVLLAESRDGHFWRANDSVLGRPVAIHVVAADDERAPRLMEAARAAASVRDTRLLRVLDAETTDDIAYVVNEWGTGTSLDHMLTGSGPLRRRESAWVAAEVADALAHGHAHGHAHGRLRPENVLIDEQGAVRIIGYAVEAALHGLTPGRVRTDLVDLTALVYAGLTARWAGESPSRVPSAPVDHDRVLRPRQVRAGVPRMLDDLCDRVLSRRGEPLTAEELHRTLMAYVGDPSAFGTPRPAAPLGGADETQVREPLESVQSTPEAAEPTATKPPAGTAPEPGQPLLVPPVVPGVPDEVPAEASEKLTEAPAGKTASDGAADRRPDPGDQESTEAMAPPVREAAPDRPEPDATEPGLPTFDDPVLDTDWTAPREDPAPPPPPLEPPPPKPLFADEPRKPRPQEQLAPEPSKPEPDAEYWPWSGSGPAVDLDDEPDSDRVPGRSWLRLAIGIAVGAVLLICVALAYNAGQGHDLLGGGGDESSSTSPSTSSGSPSTAPAPVKGVTARDFDPFGDPPAEYPDLTHYAVDGNPSTSWRTSTYTDQFGPAAPALKPGVGLVLDLKASYAVSSVHLDLIGSPTSVSVFVSDSAPTKAPTGKPSGQGQLGASGDVKLPDEPHGRYVLLWFTSLPHASDGYRLEVAEAKVTGAKLD